MKTKKLAFRRPRHIFARVVCLLLAVIFWLYVMYAAAPPYDETYYNIPVAVLGGEESGFIGSADALPSVRVLASKKVLYTLDEGDIIATVSLADLDGKGAIIAGRSYVLKVTFQLPDGVTVDGEYTVSVNVTKKTETV